MVTVSSHGPRTTRSIAAQIPTTTGNGAYSLSNPR